MTVMASADLPDDVPDDSSVRIGEIDYRLLLLSCVIGEVGQLAGVAAVSGGEPAVSNVKQAQLLTAIAAHLVATSD
jgi:hypothetical protein